jgi:hypothetical protein
MNLMPQPPHHRTRDGVALVLAMVILAALLLLGLPLLFSQSASVTGARSFADNKIGRAASLTAQNLAIDAAARAIAPQMVSPPEGASDSSPGTCLPWAFNIARLSATTAYPYPYPYPALPANTLATDLPWIVAGDDGSMALNSYAPLFQWQQSSTRVAISARFSDEAGKFDPNHMSAAMWSGLFTALNIPDWDDSVVPPPQIPWPEDSDYYGNLANALAECPASFPGGRITELEQLLTVQARYANANLRKNLTRAELERLRPYLTLWNPQPGRGIIDLGTVVASDNTFGPSTSYLILDSNPGDDQDFSAAPYAAYGSGTFHPGSSILGNDTVLVTSLTETSPTTWHVRGYGGDNYFPLDNFQAGGGGGGVQAWGREIYNSSGGLLNNTPANTVLAIDPPPALNLHHLPTVLRQALSLPATNSGVPPFNPAMLNWVPRPLDAPAAGGAPSRLPTPGSLALVGGYNCVPDNSAASPVTYSWTTFNLFARRSPLGVTANPVNFTMSEVPPLTVTSPGVWSIEAAATVSDQSGHATAQDLRRTVVQAVPQERLLEWHWSTQAEIETALGQRFGSHVQSWPYAWQRRLGTGQSVNIPQDTADTGNETDNSSTVGLRPAPLTDITAQPPTGLAFSWMVDFGGAPAWLSPGGSGPRQDANIFNTTGGDNPLSLAPNTAPDPTTIRPDGYHQKPVQGDAPIAYAIRVNNANSPFTTAVPNTTTEMDPLQVSFWFAPETTWTPGNGSGHTVYTLCEARTPDANASPQTNVLATGAPGKAGSGDNQNGWALYYDVTTRMLVLTTASPAIEHDHDEGWTIPSDDPTTPSLNETCESLTGANGIFLAPQCIQTPGPLAALFPMWTPGRALHIFRTPDDANGVPYFRAHQWYHVQLALASDRPEEAHIILDGICGQDMAKKAAGDPVLVGDHETLPTVVLATALPYLSSTATSTVNDLVVDPLAVTIPGGFGLTAANLLPARGIVRIDDEYISYDHIEGNNLRNCQRAVRQNTDVAISWQTWPTRQQHDIGALVSGGGFRLGTQAGHWYRGGCTLVDDFGQGDTTDDPVNLYSYGTVWGRLDPSQLADVSPATNPPTKLLSATSANIAITGTPAVIAQFPKDGGIIRIHNLVDPAGINPTVLFIMTGGEQYLAYDSFDDTTFHNCRAINTWNAVPTVVGYPAYSNITFVAAAPPIVSLIGIKVTGKDALVPGRYLQPGILREQDALIQLLDPVDGAVEWLGYDHIMDDPNNAQASYFENDDAWFNRRGQQRTGIALTPAGGRVIPVQSDIGAGGHMLAAGDCLTLMPFQPLSAVSATRPFQVVVRYAATDGFTTSATPSNAADCKNEYFALADAITADNDPTPLFGNQFEILCAPCWSGIDLTGAGVAAANGLGSVPTGNSYPPRLELFNPNLFTNVNAAPGGGAWYLGGADPASTLSSATAASFTNPDITIDQIATGRLHPSYPGSPILATTGAVAIPTGILRFFVGGVETLAIGPDIATVNNGLIVQATQPIFTGPYNNAKMGLVDIDGEVFAYQQLGAVDAATILAAVQAQVAAFPAGQNPYAWANPPVVNQASDVIGDGYFAKLVARGLLDTDAGAVADATCGYAHMISDAGPGEPHHRVIPASILPLGPVWQLAPNQTITDGQFFGFTNDANGDIVDTVPAIRTTAMVIPENGDQSRAEMLQLLGPDVHGEPGNPALPNPNLGEFTTAHWLHGMYNSVPATAAWAATNNPIFIGWWPRYASSLPADDGNASPTVEQFRCRSFAWVGFPVTVAEGFFWPKLLATFPAPWSGMKMAEITNIDDRRDANGANPAFIVEARALTAKEDDDWTGAQGGPAIAWRSQAATDLVPTSTALGTVTDASAVFDANDTLQRFSDGTQAVGCHGAELRITWHYNTTPSSLLRDVANAGNLAPAIGSVRIRGLAPVTVLANRLSP